MIIKIIRVSITNEDKLTEDELGRFTDLTDALTAFSNNLSDLPHGARWKIDFPANRTGVGWE